MPAESKRVEVALTTSAHLFHMYSMEANRGPKWKPSDMPKLIEEWVNIYAGSNEIPEGYWPEMIQMALEFYNRYLKEPLEQGIRKTV